MRVPLEPDAAPSPLSSLFHGVPSVSTPPWRRRLTLLPALVLLTLSMGVFWAGCEQIEKLVEAIDSISDGAPCSAPDDCLGGTCLGAEQGYPGGYCTTTPCAEVGCGGFGAECFRAELGGTDTTACYETCDADGTCDRAAEGYTCQTLADTPVCLPPGAAGASVLGAIGSACSTTAQCNGPKDQAVCLQTFFGGYCSLLSCTLASECPDMNPCVPLNPMGATEEEKRFACMDGCSDQDPCRFGYTCQEYEGARICLEASEGQKANRNPDGADDGAACVSNIQCKGNTCIREVESASGGTSYPGGYCTTRDCDSDAECNGAASVCVSRNRSTSCRQSCTTQADCRTGYVCREGETERKYCETQEAPAVSPTDTSGSGIDVECSTSKSYTFTIPQGAQSFFVAPFTTESQRIVPLTLARPNGTTLNIQTGYSFLAINQDILGNLSPLLFPASDSSEFKTAFGPGQYTLTVQSAAREVCFYVVPQPAPGTTLELNLYFVGVPGVTAQAAPMNANITEMVGVMKNIYGKMGVTVNVRQYIEAQPAVSQKYQIIRDFFDVFNLVATSTPPTGGTKPEFSVNVFLIRDFNVSDAPGLLGVSTGIPGMAGFHGSSGSGLVFSTASLGSDNATLGQTLAHEVGHFLGLRHTTEHGGRDKDPITDTPSCVEPNLAFLCSDANNFMFPFSLGGSTQTKTTNGQGFVLRANPLIK